MPEDSRSSSHNPPEQDEHAPAWWAELGREDLPHDNSRHTFRFEERDGHEPDPPASPVLRWGITLVMVAVVCLGAVLVVRATSATFIPLAMVLFGIPAVFACLATVAMLRRSNAD